MTGDERQPWELAEESDDAERDMPATSEPIEEQERGRATDGPSEEEEGSSAQRAEGEPPPERSHQDEGEVGAGSQYAAEDAREHSDPKGPAGGAGGPR